MAIIFIKKALRNQPFYGLTTPDPPPVNSGRMKLNITCRYEFAPQFASYVRGIVSLDFALVRIVQRVSVICHLNVDHINVIWSEYHQVGFIEAGFALQTWLNNDHAASLLKSPLDSIYYAVVSSYPPPMRAIAFLHDVV